jgi:hypothetical protein
MKLRLLMPVLVAAPMLLTLHAAETHHYVPERFYNTFSFAHQAVGRKLAMYMNQRKRVRQEGQRREVFLRYLGEVATAVASIKGYGDQSRTELYGRLVEVAKRKTAVADTQLNPPGKKVEPAEEEFGENVLIVPQHHGQETEAD